MNKRGQVYLIAAMILIAVVIGIAAISNYAGNKSSTAPDLENLKGQIQIESGKTLDYGINNNLGQAGINNLLQDFCQNYIDSNQDKNLYFIFGEQGNMTLKGYQKSAHTIYFNDNLVTSTQGEFFESINPGGNSVTLKIDGDLYPFTVNDGENFYFLLSRESNGGNYIVNG